MAYDDRKKLIADIEASRKRKFISILNFDRAEQPQKLGTNMLFAEDLKEPLFRVLRETIKPGDKLDVFLYTRGGETNAVWPIACLLREFDAEFEILVPYRAHSSGTLLALAAKRVVMTPLAELSPIDPTTGNQFNPRDESDKSRLGISVEDVSAYQEFVKRLVNGDGKTPELIQPHLLQLTTNVHPLALGNVQRVVNQIKVLARLLLKQHYGEGANIDAMIDNLTTAYYSHHHSISRREAKTILGEEHVVFADEPLSKQLDELLRMYEDNFGLRQAFFLQNYVGDDAEKDVRLIGGCLESGTWGYLYESRLKVRQMPAYPQNIQVQVQPGKPLPFAPGIPRRLDYGIVSRGWVRNKAPQGVAI